jgi:cytochrome b6-f complex iron-sulfur subunit
VFVKTDLQAESAPQAEPTVDRRRRGILGAMLGTALGLGFTALGLCGALWTAIIGRFLMPNVVTEPASKFKVGFPGDYPAGYVESRFREKHGVWIVNAAYRGRRQISALRTVCTHLGCIVIWQESQQVFKCPCHGSGFYPNGINYEGPAPRPLERCAIRIAEDGQLEVDASVTFQEELGQWNDPASYIPA